LKCSTFSSFVGSLRILITLVISTYFIGRSEIPRSHFKINFPSVADCAQVLPHKLHAIASRCGEFIGVQKNSFNQLGGIVARSKN